MQQNIEYIILCVHFGEADPKKTKAKIENMKKLAWEREKLILPIGRDFSLEEKFYGDYEPYEQYVEKMFAFFASKSIPNVFMVLTEEEYMDRKYKDNFGFEFPVSGIMVSDRIIDGGEAVPRKVIMNDSEKTTLSYKDFSYSLLVNTNIRKAYLMGEHLWWDRSLVMKEIYKALVDDNRDFVGSVDAKTGKETIYNRYDALDLRINEIENKKMENLISAMRGGLTYNAEMFEYFGAMIRLTPDGFKTDGEFRSGEQEAIKMKYRSVKGIPGCIYPTKRLTESSPAEYFPQSRSAFTKGLSTEPNKIIPEGKGVALIHPIINEIYRSMEGATLESVQRELLKSKHT